MSAPETTQNKAAGPLPKPKNQELWRMANALRALAMDAVQQANSGHPGMPMGMADVATVLFKDFLKYDAADPNWPDRDRFVLSAGHGSMLLYGLLHLTGYSGIGIDELKRFRQLGSPTAGHPEYGHAAGIETTTGPLGQGIATAVGMALAERMMAARFPGLVDHKTYVIAGDGCLMEGISHEAISLAGHLKLGKLIVLWDNNSISIDGGTDLSVSDDQVKRFQAHGWKTYSVDGHDTDAVTKALKAAQRSAKPVFIACRTTIAFGAPTKAGTSASHGSPLGPEEIKGARERLGWNYPPFVVPDEIRKPWLDAGKRGASKTATWRRKLKKDANRAEFERRVAGQLPDGWQAGLDALKAKYVADAPSLATRQSSNQAIEAILPSLPEFLGGSADLTGSNLTKGKNQKPITPDDFSGSYVYYGVREHGMAAAMNGLALHGGFIPYGGTFLVFTDYCRPSIRLAALMGIRVIYVMTHDSIGLGEDGPTHQPVEHLTSLRAMPNLQVFRPADAVETAECWALALSTPKTPSVLSLTRQNVPTLRKDVAENRSAKGGYVLAEAEGTRQVTLLATGSEVTIAMAAREMLKAKGVAAAVVSLPCWELFDAQSEAYRQTVLGQVPRISVEAAATYGWERYIGDKGESVGMTTFGASAPIGDLYKHFNITAEHVAGVALSKI